MTHSLNDKGHQIDRFKKAASQLEVDESEDAFDEKLKKIAQPVANGAKMQIPRDKS